MRAFLVIEKPNHGDPDERRIVTEWMPAAYARALRDAMLARAGARGAYVEVQIVPEVRTK